MTLARKIQETQGFSIPKLVKIPLGTAITDREFNVSGDILAFWLAPSFDTEITIRFNNNDEPAMPFRRGSKISTPFRKIYVTVPSGLTGTGYLAYGAGYPDMIDIFPPQSTSETTVDEMLAEMQSIDTKSDNLASLANLATILGQLRGTNAAGSDGCDTVGIAASVVMAANNDRVGCVFHSDSGNANKIYLGFTNAVTSSAYAVELAAGERYTFDNYRGPVYAIAGGAGQTLAHGEW